MANLQETLLDIAKAIVDSPDEVRVTTEEDERLVAETFRAHHVPLIAEIRGKGTAPSEFLDILGLGGSTRILTCGCVPTQQVPELFSAMKQFSPELQGLPNIQQRFFSQSPFLKRYVPTHDLHEQPDSHS